MPTQPGLRLAHVARAQSSPLSVRDILSKLTDGARLPFCAGDVTAGSESELQAAVAGQRQEVDLPRRIEASAHYANLLRRVRCGDTSPRVLGELQQFLRENRSGVWENSWVRFERGRLGPLAARVLAADLKSDKADPASPLRKDAERFFVRDPGGQDCIRVPVSYLLKLALAEVLGKRGSMSASCLSTSRGLMDHFLSDNTSPETFSFYVSLLRPGDGMGEALAKETAQRYLLSQLLTQYANDAFGLAQSGQKALIYFSPHTPIRQKQLGGIIPDGFYRDLFMSPCLSGWDRGEEKHAYMRLCHKVLGRSQLNAVAKMREAGIITRNLVVLPGASNLSLANNGTHISLGSRLLTDARANQHSGFGAAEEKHVGDLAIKIMEHFLPLFVGSCSAAPYRLGFEDFHPERALGFLPHELDYTHLRMLWRRWKKKGRFKVLGRSVTPFGPPWLDRGLSRLLRLRGDWVPDFRLVDYPVCFLSTPQSPAFDGSPGNQQRLKADLASEGSFDERMSLYLFMRQRQFDQMGYSGFEGRHYSLFEDLLGDMGLATDLQALISALAFKYMAEGRLDHRHIPDDPAVESERRQIFFALSLGVPTFYVRRHSRNRFLLRILKRTRNIRVSSRYPGYFRVQVQQYCLALLELLQEDAGELLMAMNLESLLAEMRRRIRQPGEYGAAGKLNRAVLERCGAKSSLKVEARDYNQACEQYYREDLKRRHLAQALDSLGGDLRAMELRSRQDAELRVALHKLAGEGDALGFLHRVQGAVLDESLPAPELERLILLTLMNVDDKKTGYRKLLEGDRQSDAMRTPVHRAL